MSKPLTENQQKYNEARRLDTLENIEKIAEAMLANPDLSVNNVREKFGVSWPVARAARIKADSGCTAAEAKAKIEAEPASKTSPVKAVTRKAVHSQVWSNRNTARRFNYVYL